MATDEQLRLIASVEDRAFGPLRQLENTLSNFRRGGGAPGAALAKDFGELGLRARSTVTSATGA